MPAGRMNQRLKLFRESDDPQYDSQGRLISSPVGMMVCWAEVVPLSGQEQLIAQQIDPKLSHTVRLRYSPTTASITAGWWLESLDGTRRFEISSVKNLLEKCVTIELFCTERAAETV